MTTVSTSNNGHIYLRPSHQPSLQFNFLLAPSKVKVKFRSQSQERRPDIGAAPLHTHKQQFSFVLELAVHMVYEGSDVAQMDSSQPLAKFNIAKITFCGCNPAATAKGEKNFTLAFCAVILLQGSYLYFIYISDCTLPRNPSRT